MIDAYTASLIGVAGITLGVLLGTLIQSQNRKRELERIEAFQKTLSEQNRISQEEHHAAEMKKIDHIAKLLANISQGLRH
jgi:uncharacterized membrane protein YraQ (UPF0718 family)